LTNSAVADASIVLALVYGEERAEQVAAQSEYFLLSAVNAAEAQSVLVRSGVPGEIAWAAVRNAVAEVIPFDGHQARIAGELIDKTKRLGLSLGDRSCLALGIARGLPVYTTDEAWVNLKADVQVHVIR
jgi:ribonuclease VapC